jgi:hypothetical protein
MKRYDASIAAFVAGKPVVPDTSLPEGVKTLLASLVIPANLPFARELWLENPAHLASQVSEPMLILIGNKDVQVDWCADAGPLQTATSKNGKRCLRVRQTTRLPLRRPLRGEGKHLRGCRIEKPLIQP